MLEGAAGEDVSNRSSATGGGQLGRLLATGAGTAGEAVNNRSSGAGGGTAGEAVIVGLT